MVVLYLVFLSFPYLNGQIYIQKLLLFMFLTGFLEWVGKEKQFSMYVRRVRKRQRNRTLLIETFPRFERNKKKRKRYLSGAQMKQ